MESQQLSQETQQLTEMQESFQNAMESTTEQMITNIEQRALQIASGAATLTQQETISQLARDCNQGDQQEKHFPIRVVAARDPNAKVGPLGIGEQHYVPGVDPLRYAVYFENMESASAPAQEVFITDTLEIDTLDPTTVRLERITFGDHTLSVSPGILPHTAEVDLRPQENLIVRISAELDLVSGVLSVYFASIDPATGQLIDDPLGGFLPPNSDGSGEGAIVFSVMPKTGLASGTLISNRATIVFDDNEAIVTNEWTNTIDGQAPSSQVQPLNANHAATFNVQWAGSDAGSAVQDYSVFVSYDGGEWQPWLSNTTATTATFNASAAGDYAFYTIARDVAGNVETAPATPDATTQVKGQFLLPYITVGP
jgi:hypothetical protein